MLEGDHGVAAIHELKADVEAFADGFPTVGGVGRV